MSATGSEATAGGKAPAPRAKPGTRAARRKKSFIREWTETIGGALILFFVVRSFFFQAYQIPSESMENTLLVGDYLFVNKLIYGAHVPFTQVQLPRVRHPHRGDVAIFTDPRDNKTTLIKRVIGTPGDTLQIQGGAVSINGEVLEEPYTKYLEGRRNPPTAVDPRILPKGAGSNMDYYGPVVIPAGHYFMMGDNRDRSDDSRFRGFIEEKRIRGRAEILYFSKDGPFYHVRFNRIGHLVR